MPSSDHPAGFHGGGGERRMRYDVSGLSRGAELHDMLKAEIMLRRLKRDVLSQVGASSVGWVGAIVGRIETGWEAA